MITRIFAIALNTYREAVRQKIFFTLVFFTTILIAFSFLLGQLSLGADTKVIKDMGLASIMIFGSLIAIFMGIGLVFKEVEQRTIYTILSKPVSRPEFVIGKFFGLALTIAVEVIFMTMVLFAVLSFYREPLDYNLLKPIILIYFELLVLVGMALLFSSYSSALMSSLFCVSLLVIGHITDDLADIFGKNAWKLVEAGGSDATAGHLILGLLNTLQLFNLDHFSINSKIVHGVPVEWTWVFSGMVYGACFVSILLMGAIYLFRKKDLV